MEHIVFLERHSLDAEVRRPAFAHSCDAAESATLAIVNKTPLRAADIPNFILTPHVAWASK